MRTKHFLLFLSLISLFACNSNPSQETKTTDVAIAKPAEQAPPNAAVDSTASAVDGKTQPAATNTSTANPEKLAQGKQIYEQYCLACHQTDGRGVSGMYPPVAASDWVQGDKTRLINVLLNGLQGEIKVNGETYNQVMPAHNFLKDEEIAAVLTYVRQNFGNTGDEINTKEVTALRK